jgi:ketosteroid isomerase-like protein
MTRRTLVLPLLWLAVLAACSRPAPSTRVDTAADEATLRARTDLFLQAFNAGDVQGTTAWTREDAIQMPTGGPELVGKPAIMEAGARFMSAFTASQKATVEEVAVWGDVGMSRGTWEVTETPKDGSTGTMVRRGKWLVIHKRAPDGSWGQWRHIWNQDEAVPAAQ